MKRRRHNLTVEDRFPKISGSLRPHNPPLLRLRRLIGASSGSRRSRRRRRRRHVLRPNPTRISESKHLLHKSTNLKTVKLQSKQTKTVRRETASLLTRWLRERERERAMAKLLNLTSATAQRESAKR